MNGEIRIDVDEQVAQGIYSNLALITHSDSEFTLDFVYIQPQAPKAKVRARIITSPQHLKRFLGALSENLKKFEEKFGEIKLKTGPENQERKIGF